MTQDDKKFLQALLDELPAFFCVVDAESHKILFGDPKALSVFSEDVIGKTIEEVGAGNTLMLGAGEEVGHRYEYTANIKNHWYWITQYTAAMPDDTDAIVFFGVDYADIKNFDSLPSIGFENKDSDQARIKALQYLERHIRKYRSGLAPSFSVCRVDIVGLKTVYETLGREKSDDYTRTIQHVIQDAIRGSDTFLPMGGDAFMVLFHKCSAYVAERIMSTIKSRLEFLSEESEVAPPYSITFRIYEISKTEKPDAEAAMAALT